MSVIMEDMGCWIGVDPELQTGYFEKELIHGISLIIHLYTM